VPHAPIEIALIGPDGAGKRTLAAQICAFLGVGMLVADADALLGADQPRGAAARHAIHAARAAALCQSALYWHNAESIDPRVWEQRSGPSNLIFLGARRTPGQGHDQAARWDVRIPRLTRSGRVALWGQLTRMPPPPPVREWALTPAEVATAARVASAGEAAVVRACRQALHHEPEELFVPLPCPYTWDDIVLIEEVRQHLMELERQARLRAAVYEEWGFERLTPLGRGVTALFAGPSGTGKTMAAQVLARALDVELYRVDLAGVVNKYIGETEKRLKLVFDACERANVLLFFDEADALFGQRTQVKDAHDRFANIEIDYLLQRMEQFDGLAVLATNRKSDMDSAFVRRLRFIVDFLPPGPAERLALWHLALLDHGPQGQPLLDEIDWEFLASKLTMTGAQIKSAALGAAFLARGDGARITMRHVLHAARREFSKIGMVLRELDPPSVREQRDRSVEVG
jgi:ATP-dependent 26S proteasome regulatory subunit